jgi:hypothetical protein
MGDHQKNMLRQKLAKTTFNQFIESKFPNLATHIWYKHAKKNKIKLWWHITAAMLWQL